MVGERLDVEVFIIIIFIFKPQTEAALWAPSAGFSLSNFLLNFSVQ